MRTTMRRSKFHEWMELAPWIVFVNAIFGGLAIAIMLMPKPQVNNVNDTVIAIFSIVLDLVLTLMLVATGISIIKHKSL